MDAALSRATSGGGGWVGGVLDSPVDEEELAEEALLSCNLSSSGQRACGAPPAAPRVPASPPVPPAARQGPDSRQNRSLVAADTPGGLPRDSEQAAAAAAARIRWTWQWTWQEFDAGSALAGAALGLSLACLVSACSRRA